MVKSVSKMTLKELNITRLLVNIEFFFKTVIQCTMQNGWMAEWLCSGLQSRLRRFDSGFSLHDINLNNAQQKRVYRRQFDVRHENPEISDYLNDLFDTFNKNI